MPRWCVVGLLLALHCVAPAIKDASAQGLPLSGQLAPKTPQAADKLFHQTRTTLAELLGRPCLPDNADQLIALADNAIAQLAAFREASVSSGFSPGPNPLPQLDRRLRLLRQMLADVRKKKTCPPPGTAPTPPSAPGAAPQPPAAPPKKPTVLNLPPGTTTLTPSAPPPIKPPKPPVTPPKKPTEIEEIREAYKLSKCLTDEEVRRVDRLIRDTSILQNELDLLNQGREFIQSGMTLPDFINSKFETKTLDADGIRHMTDNVRRQADKIYQNPLIIQEKERLLREKEAELDELRKKRCADDVGLSGFGDTQFAFFFGTASGRTTFVNVSDFSANIEDAVDPNRVRASGTGFAGGIGASVILGEIASPFFGYTGGASLAYAPEARSSFAQRFPLNETSRLPPARASWTYGIDGSVYFFASGDGHISGIPGGPFGTASGQDSFKISNNVMLTIGGIVTMPVAPSWRVSLTGGFAELNQTVRYHCVTFCAVAPATPAFSVAQDKWLSGAYVGGRVEMPVTLPGLAGASIGIDYKHMFFSSYDVSLGTVPTRQVNARLSPDMDIVTLRFAVPLR